VQMHKYFIFSYVPVIIFDSGLNIARALVGTSVPVAHIYSLYVGGGEVWEQQDSLPVLNQFPQ